MKANQLLVEIWLLHHIVSQIFLPKVERFDFIIEHDILIMFHVVQGITLNLPTLICYSRSGDDEPIEGMSAL